MSNRPSSFTRRFAFASAAALLLASACGSSDDPQLGEDERLRFVAGRGCSSSTTLAVGATATMRLESATEDPLPGDLDVLSEDTSVMTARLGLEPATIDLTALKQGESRIVVTSEDEEVDALVVGAQPAATVKVTSENLVFQGASLDVIVNDVFGDCGAEECRLLGDGFLGWRVEPAERASFLLEFEGVATFRAKSAGPASILGLEPARKKDVVTHAFEVLPPTATGLSALLISINFDKSKDTPVISLPGTLPRPDGFSINLMATATSGQSVAIARRDIVWRVEGEELVVESPTIDERDPLTTLFLTTGTGKVTLVAEVPVLTLEQSFELELTP